MSVPKFSVGDRVCITEDLTTCGGLLLASKDAVGVVRAVDEDGDALVQFEEGLFDGKWFIEPDETVLIPPEE